MLHPSTCQSAMNMKDEKLGYILLVEYKNVYVSVYSNVKQMNSAFGGFREYVHLFGNAFGNVIQPETEPSI